MPLLITAPGKIPAGQKFDGLVGNIDIAPTLLEAASAPPLPNADGNSFWKALTDGQPDSWSREHPAEMHNLIDSPEHAERIERMNQQLWQMLFASNGHDMPLLEDHGPRFPARDPNSSPQAKFPTEYFQSK